MGLREEQGREEKWVEGESIKRRRSEGQTEVGIFTQL